MPLIGWSMSKMAINALVGIAVQDGKLTLADSALLPEWRGDADSRITLDQLLRMTTGLSFNEDYTDHSSDVIQMLFVQGDKAGFAAAKPLEHSPGTYWQYSSGTSNIIARILRQRFADEQEYLRFPCKRLFEPLGMSSAVLEPASARDWARLGLLFLHDGQWQGQRLLPEGWVAYSLTPTKDAPDARYGAHVWLKLPKSPGLGEPQMPADTYYDEQVVAVVPSRDLVIVRLGITREEGAWDHARDLAPIVRAFPPRLPGARRCGGSHRACWNLRCSILPRRPSGRTLRSRPLIGAAHSCLCWHIADVPLALMNVRFERNKGHDADVTRCLLLTQSGQSLASPEATIPCKSIEHLQHDGVGCRLAVERRSPGRFISSTPH